MTKELTPWFPRHVAPRRVGVYQVLINGKLKYSRWGKGQWHLALADFARAKQSRIRSGDFYREAVGGWRGLAKEPK